MATWATSASPSQKVPITSPVAGLMLSPSLGELIHLPPIQCWAVRCSAVVFADAIVPVPVVMIRFSFYADDTGRVLQIPSSCSAFRWLILARSASLIAALSRKAVALAMFSKG